MASWVKIEAGNEEEERVQLEASMWHMPLAKFRSRAAEREGTLIFLQSVALQ